MKQREGPLELAPILDSTLPEIAAFLHRRLHGDDKKSHVFRPVAESVDSIERRLKWLLSRNPAVTVDSPLGYYARDSLGTIRGVNLCFPVVYAASERRLLGLCSGSFFVEPSARSTGFYLLRKCLNTPGYAFHFASSCNSVSSNLWKAIGACPVPNSDKEYIFPLNVNTLFAAYVARRTSSRNLARAAQICSCSANTILTLFTRFSEKLTLKPCQDWEKLSELSRRHRLPDHITNDRSPAFLEWRYGPASPSYPCTVYLFSDRAGNEGWFCLGHFRRGDRWQFRASVLLDVIWPRHLMSFRDVLEQIIRVSAASGDVISFRWQPGLEYCKYHVCMIRRNFKVSRAFVHVTKGAPRLPLDMLDYDNSDFIAWTFQWQNG